MVLRKIDDSPFYLKIDGKWVYVNEEVLRNHPGGSAITTYRNKDLLFRVCLSLCRARSRFCDELTMLAGHQTTQRLACSLSTLSRLPMKLRRKQNAFDDTSAYFALTKKEH
ncbi:hypothetical protein ANCDUO_25776 [Ancylostoma duodenale]|uniref:Cytochrome b5 heme-binding domain-containing protein n=1 Tax=Ancylostoma duodenale TaxID=51022 RepID=A0A0C2F6Q2_9BILA|nr:hypothetical protein ANCDUO_25776 [Ancylostoma duodenale]